MPRDHGLPETMMRSLATELGRKRLVHDVDPSSDDLLSQLRNQLNPGRFRVSQAQHRWVSTLIFTDVTTPACPAEG